jgi:hypothetical protein
MDVGVVILFCLYMWLLYIGIKHDTLLVFYIAYPVFVCWAVFEIKVNKESDTTLTLYFVGTVAVISGIAFAIFGKRTLYKYLS